MTRDFDFRKNNFDLIRLLAALQVVFTHGCEHFEIELPPLLRNVVGAFPGVPIFFVISGFLIAASWERSTSLRSYVKNRFLRIYPGLWACFFFSLITVFAFFRPDFTWPEFAGWILAQVTVAQFYNPEFMRPYGVGVLNGSLWTIPVELQFYLLLPIAYWLLSRVKWNAVVLYAVMAALIVVNQWFVSARSVNDTLVLKLLGVSVMPYLYIFLLGVLLQRNLGFVAAFLKGRAAVILLVYALVSLGTRLAGLPHAGNYLNPIAAFVLSLLTISFAYSYADKLNDILKGNDISYGVYIYHMVFVNALLHLSGLPPSANLALMLVLTVLAALLSWKLVEKPSLALKSYSIYSRRRNG